MRQVNLLVDIQAKLQAGKGAGYERWAKVFNLKQMAQTLNYLSENNLINIEDLTAKTDAAIARVHERQVTIRETEKRMAELHTCRTDSRESWNRMVFAVFASTICATPVPACCLRTTYRWKKFRNGSDTATSPLRQIFTLILTINQKYLRQKQCWQDWAWIDVQHSSLLSNEKSLTKPSFARLPSMASYAYFDTKRKIKR